MTSWAMVGTGTATSPRATSIRKVRISITFDLEKDE